jgi:hypothetical protein
VCLQIDTPTRIYFLQAGTIEERDAWMWRLVSCLHRLRRLDTQRRVSALKVSRDGPKDKQQNGRRQAWRGATWVSAGELLTPLLAGEQSSDRAIGLGQIIADNLREPRCATDELLPKMSIDEEMDLVGYDAGGTDRHGYLLLGSTKNGREKGWRRRWLTLQGEVVHFYSSHTNTRERGMVPCLSHNMLFPTFAHLLTPRAHAPQVASTYARRQRSVDTWTTASIRAATASRGVCRSTKSCPVSVTKTYAPTLSCLACGHSPPP